MRESETAGKPDPSDGGTKFERVVGAVVLLCVVILMSGAGLVGGIDGKLRNRA